MSPPTPQGTFKSASERREGREKILLRYRCSFHPERKTFLVSTCSQLQLLSCWLLLSSPLEHPSLSSYDKARWELWVFAVRSLTYLGAPSGHRIAPDQGEKCGREDRSEPELRECASERGRAGRRASSRRAHSLGLSHHGHCVLLHWRFHTQICFPISNLQLYNKRFLCTKTVVIRPSANRMWNRRWLHAREILF